MIEYFLFFSSHKTTKKQHVDIDRFRNISIIHLMPFKSDRLSVLINKSDAKTTHIKSLNLKERERAKERRRRTTPTSNSDVSMSIFIYVFIKTIIHS